MKLSKPTNQTAEILYELLHAKKRLSFFDLYFTTRAINLGQRIADLRRNGLLVPCLRMETKNKHGRPVKYGTWSIAGEKEKALEVYQKINRPKK